MKCAHDDVAYNQIKGCCIYSRYINAKISTHLHEHVSLDILSLPKIFRLHRHSTSYDYVSFELYLKTEPPFTKEDYEILLLAKESS